MNSQWVTEALRLHWTIDCVTLSADLFQHSRFGCEIEGFFLKKSLNILPRWEGEEYNKRVCARYIYGNSCVFHKK